MFSLPNRVGLWSVEIQADREVENGNIALSVSTQIQYLKQAYIVVTGVAAYADRVVRQPDISKSLIAVSISFLSY